MYKEVGNGTQRDWYYSTDCIKQLADKVMIRELYIRQAKA